MSTLSSASTVAVALLLASVGAARAEDLPAPLPSHRVPLAAVAPLYDWTTFHVVAQTDGSWSHASSIQNVGGTSFPVAPYAIHPSRAHASSHTDLGDQTGTPALGAAEVDLATRDPNGSTTTAAFDQTYLFNVQPGTPAPIHGRASRAYWRLAPFGSRGGMTPSAAPTLDRPDGSRTGWIGGVGAGYALSRNWSAKVDNLSFRAIRLSVSRKFGAASRKSPPDEP